MTMMDTEFEQRLRSIVDDIELAGNFSVVLDRDMEVGGVDGGRFYFQIRCWRKDTITGEMGYGYGGKAYLSPYAVDSELVGTIFSLYKGYVEHEARETFKWRKRRIYGPHIDIEALHEVARRVSYRKPVGA